MDSIPEFRIGNVRSVWLTTDAWPNSTSTYADQAVVMMNFHGMTKIKVMAMVTNNGDGNVTLTSRMRICFKLSL